MKKAMQFVGMAIVTAAVPVLIGSSPAHADPGIHQPCSAEGTKTWTPQDGGLVCGNAGPFGLLQWVPDEFARCVNPDVCGRPNP